MKAAIYLFVATAIGCAALAVGCGDDETNSSTGNSTTTSTSTGTAGGGGSNNNPQFPAIGTQVERMGRPAINTATNHTFDADPATKDVAKDAWNDADRPAWNGFAGEVAKNLAILDSLDGTCGNQFLAGPDPVAGRYDALAGVLADDRLWVNLSAATCTTYLAVEAGADDCGGRRLTDDVIETSYSLLATDALTGVDDTITADAAKTGGETFPFLAPPL